MGRITINQIINRYQAGFGYVALNWAVAGANRLWSNMANIPVFTEAQEMQSGSAEIPLFTVADLTFADATFKNSKSGNMYAFGVNFDGNSGILGPPLMVSFTRDKNVVRTPIDRSEVEVIEYFGLKPFNISIQGILVDNSEHQYPSDLVKSISQMFSEPGMFEVTSEIFLDLGITEVFFDSGFNIGFVEGYMDTVKFSVNAISTLPVEAKLIKSS